MVLVIISYSIDVSSVYPKTIAAPLSIKACANTSSFPDEHAPRNTNDSSIGVKYVSIKRLVIQYCLTGEYDTFVPGICGKDVKTIFLFFISSLYLENSSKPRNVSPVTKQECNFVL